MPSRTWRPRYRWFQSRCSTRSANSVIRASSQLPIASRSRLSAHILRVGFSLLKNCLGLTHSCVQSLSSTSERQTPSIIRRRASWWASYNGYKEPETNSSQFGVKLFACGKASSCVPWPGYILSGIAYSPFQ